MAVNPRGVIFLGLSIALMIIGLLRVDGVLMTLGAVGLLVGFGAAAIGRWNLTGLDFQLVGPRRVFAGKDFDLRLTHLNRRALFPIHDLDLELRPAKGVCLTGHAAFTPAQSSAVSKLRGALPQRGIYEKHPCLASSTFPLGLFRFQKRFDLFHEILAFPQPILPRELFARGGHDETWEGDGHRTSEALGEPRGLRAFQPGDRAKQIHWPATVRALSRGRNPRVREFDPPGFRPRKVEMIFHSFGTDHTLIRTDLFERALSLVCGTLRHLRGLKVPATLRADFLGWQGRETFQKAAWSQILEDLARAVRADDTEAHDVVREIEGLAPEHALIILSDMPPEAWKHLAPQRPALLIDIRQYRVASRSLKLGRRSEASTH